MDPGEALLGFGLLCSVIAIVPAFVLESRRKRLKIGEKPYTWAYFHGVASLLFGSLILVIAGVAAGSADSDSIPLLGGGILFFAAYGFPGWFVICRRRWAWVVLTILSMNPISWIVGYIYGRNRWVELGVRASRHAGAASSQSTDPIAALERLADLRRRGKLTEDEYAAAKAGAFRQRSSEEPS